VRHPQGFRFFDSPVRDQEVEGSNSFAPTNIYESATYKVRKSIGRLVQGQAVDGSNLFPSITLLPFKINAVHCVLDRDFQLILADNTDSVWDFAWKFEGWI
jgi:hypothetical protein